MKRIFIALLTILCAVTAGAAQDDAMMPLQWPAVSRSHIAFVYAGRIWITGREGGVARPLARTEGEQTRPVFSPDGSQVAFAAGDGNLDVYVVPVSGDEARRLTFHPKFDAPVAWTPDGTRLLIASVRVSDSFARLFTIPVTDGFETEVPVPMGEQASYSPDGARLAYQPIDDPTRTWRNYRGGQTSPIWIMRMSDGHVEEIPRPNSNDLLPMWIGETIYFISDRTNTANLFAYDTRTKKVEQLTHFEKYDIRGAAATEDAIVFVQDGRLHLFDLRTRRSRVVPVRVEGEFEETRPRAIKAQRWIRNFNLSPAGDAALFGARGEVLTVSASGEARNLTSTPGIAERYPVWSPDGKTIAYFSDESGEYRLHLRDALSGDVRRIDIEAKPSFYGEPVWSPDSQRLAFFDKRLALWVVEAVSGKARRIDTSPHPEPNLSTPVWSADGRWLAYTKSLDSRLHGVFLYSLESERSYRVSNPLMDAEQPAFDRNGKYLYFLASSNAGPARTFGMTPVRDKPRRSGRGRIARTA